ncbi:DUF1003 domain-containing protein [Kineococcus sp. SYSU DK004]|uniref:DUF1003 domain-containing protein n=1 Tax=Kineococcus sp. SYSU DK004 TaxID=3383125 RepID=UPI003D7DB66F
MAERRHRNPFARSPRRQRNERVSLDVPRESRRQLLSRPDVDPDAFGRASEGFARFMGTGRFLVYMTAFVAVWLAWNTFMPPSLQFDPKTLNYTLLTLMLSLQASYAAPLILLAQNRQDDRDRVLNEQDRARDERALADTEYLTREVAALRTALGDVATRDFVRSELRSLLEELVADEERPAAKRKGGKKRKRVEDVAEDGSEGPGTADPLAGDGPASPALPAAHAPRG